MTTGQNPNSASVFYSPEKVPDDPKQLNRYLTNELFKVQAAISLLAQGHLNKTTVQPTKPRDGDIRYADGVNWKPNGTGSAGIWWYNGSVWTQL